MSAYQRGIAPTNHPAVDRPVSAGTGVLAVCTALVGCAALLSPGSARAALGAPYESIAADQAQSRATLQVTALGAYEVHALTLPSGTVVREYVTPSGIVFAVAWNGPSQPDLQQMLGPYFSDYTNAAQSRHGGHHHLSVTHNDVSIEVTGHMRAFSGRAVLLQALPAGVAGNELR